MDKKLLFIVNPRAGRTKSFAPLFDAVACFSKAGYLVKVFLTEGRGDATRAAAELGGAYDLVVCAGGDGTFNEMVSGLMQLPECPEVGYLPNGSTNDFAASLHIPATPLKAAESIVNGHPFYLDVGRHNDRYFAYVASFGAFTRSSYSVPQATKNALGHFAYILEGMKDLDSLRPYRCRVETGEEIFEGEFIFGAVCNSTSLGGIIVDSGKFDWKASGKFPAFSEPNPSYHGVCFAEAAGPAAFVTYVRAVILRDLGGCISPFNAWVLLQGTETLSLRLDRHNENTKKVVEFLTHHPKVEKVNHPSLPDHPDHALYEKYFPNGGASIFTFNIKGGQKEAFEFIDHLQIFSLLANVADVKSLVIHPATTTHGQLSDAELADVGIGRNTIRLSIGTEHVDDIIADLAQALDAVE